MILPHANLPVTDGARLVVEMSMDASTSFGLLLKRFRLAAGLTQEGLAERTSLSAKAISDLERDPARRPRLASVSALADALGLEPDDRAVLLALAAARPGESPDSVQSARRHDLPRALTPLIGRETELPALEALLRRGEPQIISLTGPGGVGKTRLAIEAAWRVADHFADGVVFVDLSALRDPGLVLSTIAQRLGIAERDVDVLAKRLRSELATKQMLLVVDNVEHLVSARVSLLDLVQAAPHLVLLVTSRIALRVRGEREMRVPPLDLPGEDAPADVLMRAPAVALFLERARDVGSEPVLTPETRSAIAAICRRVDGLPLAIELAAARLPLLSPAALLERLTHRLDVLVSGAHDLPDRQQAMRDTIAWSFDLLDERQQTLFRRLAVFAGGWTIDAAEAICGEPEALPDVTVGLAALIEMNLLQRNDAVRNGLATTRLTMLDTIREFAQEQLSGTSEATSLHRRHYDYYLQLATHAEAAHQTPAYEDLLDQLEVEHDNLRQALEWSLAGSPDAGLDLIGVLWRYWRVRGWHSEGARWLDLALAQSSTPTIARTRALIGHGVLLLDVGNRDAARGRFTEALAIARQQADDIGAGLAMMNLGTLARWESDHAVARARLGEALTIFRAAEHQWEVAICLRELGNVAREDGEYDLARTMLHESLAISRQLGSRRALAWVLGDLALLARSEGDVDTARVLLEETVELYRAAKDTYDLPWAIARLGNVVGVQGDLAQARRLLAESLSRFQQTGTANGIVTVLLFTSMLVSQAGDHASAVRLLAAASRHGQSIPPVYPPDPGDLDAAMDRARAEIGESAWADASGDGAGMTLDRAAAYALSVLSSPGESSWLGGDEG